MCEVRLRERLFLGFVYLVLLFVTIAISTLAISGCLAPQDYLTVSAIGGGLTFDLYGYFNSDGTFRVNGGQGHWTEEPRPMEKRGER